MTISELRSLASESGSRGARNGAARTGAGRPPSNALLPTKKKRTWRSTRNVCSCPSK